VSQADGSQEGDPQIGSAQINDQTKN